MTIGQVRGWAISRLGLDPDSFGLLRLGVYWEALTVWAEDRDAERQSLFTLIRNIGHSLFNVQLDRNSRMSPERYIRLPWDADDQDELKGMTDEQKKRSLDGLLAALDQVSKTEEDGERTES